MQKLANSQRADYNDIKAEVEDAGFRMISTTYENAHEHLLIECPYHVGKILRVRIGDFRVSVHKCKHCAVDMRKVPFAEVVDAFNRNGHRLLSEEHEYINSESPLRYICEKHPDREGMKTYASAREGRMCPECYSEYASGENSVHYNHDISEEDRNRDRRFDAEHHRWRIKVFRRDKFTCQYCGEYERRRLNAHHMDAHHWCIERRHDVTNGISLCEPCHKVFHMKYGYRDNTEEQFEHWMSQIEDWVALSRDRKEAKR